MEIQVKSWSPVLDPEYVQPIGDELIHLYRVPVTVSSFDHEPAASGFTEIAMTIIATGAVGLIFKVFEPLVTHAGEQVRDKLLVALREGKQNNETGRRYVPLCIEFGTTQVGAPVRYCFHGHLDDAELNLRLESAHIHMQKLPVDLFAGPDSPLVNGFFWDEAAGQWRGQVAGRNEILYGEFWLPRDIWDF
jgi:hypothetical protein